MREAIKRKRQLLQEVEEFMKTHNTKDLNTNQFVAAFKLRKYGKFDYEVFTRGVSVETITRARRKVLEQNPDLERSPFSKDLVDIYVEAFTSLT